MKKKAFTIIELLTVISIVAIIIGILAPGIKKAKTIAMNLKQKSQLRAVGIGLEVWAYDNDNSYPESKASQRVSGGLITTGSHHLAEAMLGRDGHGYDPESTWDAQLDETLVPAPYTSGPPYSDRENLYIENESIQMFQLAQIYGVGAGGSTGDAYPGDYDELGQVVRPTPAGVLTDVFRRRKVQMPVSGEIVKAGSPILYFKAKDTEIFDSTIPTVSVFDWNDNESIFALGNNMDSSLIHPYDDVVNFYAPDGDIVNKNIRITATDPVPHNKNTFLLMSAGADGLYGTKDDIMNISSD